MIAMFLALQTINVKMCVCYDVDCTALIFIISLIFNILFSLQRGQPIFENGGISKRQRNDLYREGTRSLRQLCDVRHQGPLNQVVFVHMSIF